jgi:membrane associated rhomboid family serine protease
MRFNDELIDNFKHGGMYIKLIYINAAVFLFLGIAQMIGRISGDSIDIQINYLIANIFPLQTEINAFSGHPWGIITYMFSHFGLMHFIFNMFFLYFAGSLLEKNRDSKQILKIYLLGGIIGGVLEVLSRMVFPGLAEDNTPIVGASGSIMALFAAIAYLRPHTEIQFFGVFPVKLYWLAVAYFVFDLIGIGSNDGTAHIAHIGGAIGGILFIRFSDLKGFTSNKSHLSIKKGGRPLTDEEFNMQKLENEKYTNILLDKISKSGYESLSKKEKEFLFRQSKS